jgi:purine-binding chemotaxis protein CheW
MTPRKKAEAEGTGAKKATKARAKKAPARARKAAPKKTEAKAVVETPVEEPLLDEGEPDTDSGIGGIEGKMVAFFLGGQRYALLIDSVQEIQQIVEFSEVPSQGGSVVGMVNLRGTVIPALDMRLLVGLPKEEYGLETPMIIARAGDQLVALIVDEVEDVLEMPGECLQDPPRMHTLAGRMIGVCRMDTGLVYLLDVEKIVAPVDLST